MVRPVDFLPHLLAIVVAEHASGPPAPAGHQKRGCLLLSKELRCPFPKVTFLEVIFPKFGILRFNMLFLHVSVQRIAKNLCQPVIVIVLYKKRWSRVNNRRLSIEISFSRQLALPRLEVLLFLKLRYSDNKLTQIFRYPLDGN